LAAKRASLAGAVLRTADGFYRSLFDAAPVGLALTTWEGEVVEANRHLCELLGVTPAEARVLGAAAFYASVAERDGVLSALRQSGRFARREVALKRHGGRLVHTLVQAELVRLAGQELILTIIQDVTGEKLARRSVQSVRTLLQLFASSPSREDYLRSVAGLLRDWCGCAAAGIRLIDPRRRVPYEASVGLSPEFLRREARLGLDTANCACLKALREAESSWSRSHPRPTGSFLCHRTSDCLGNEGSARCPPLRLACREAGLESIAWVAIHDQKRVIGTRHLLDPQPGRFSRQTLELQKSLAPW
jgi:PAS domain S-box-containing protein